MNTLEINEILGKNIYTKHHFRGTFACCELDNIKNIRPGDSLVINTCCGDEEYCHWISLVVNPLKPNSYHKSSISIFDASGFRCDLYHTLIRDFVRKLRREFNCSNKIYYNVDPLQTETSSACGCFSIIHVYLKLIE
jgi:hypothetical protein